MDHCYLNGKSNMNPVVQNFEENARYNQVDSCWVKDIPYVKHANGREIFRIFGYGHADQTGDDGAYFTIEYNLFDHSDGEGTEIVSLKSNYNMVRYNTVIASRGGLVGRRGKFNTFEGNFIFGQGMEGTTGIRVAGANHRVFNNYIADVMEDGLRLITGEYFEKSLTSHFAQKKKDLPKYLQVENGYFANNTIINCGGFGIDVGYNYQSHWPDLQMILMPQNNRILNNVVYNCKENAINIAIEDKKPPLDIFHFKPNIFEGNIIWGSKMNVAIQEGVKLMNPKFTVSKDGFYRPEKHSPLNNGGAFSDVKTDMDGQNRVNQNGVGADEVSTERIIHHPMKSSEVGPKWMNIKK
jgi:poly(beta-D-mannuronate) lyase